MFSGIVQSVQRIKRIDHAKKLVWIKINKQFNNGIKLGDSIAVNGVCLTVEEIKADTLRFSISEETYNHTTFKYWKINQVVNLEKALSLNDRLDGHIVYGHVNRVVQLISIEHKSNTYFLEFEFSDSIPSLLYKDSIAINGVSLTINDVNKNKFIVSIIPFTYEHTNFKFLKLRDWVNVETNLLNSQNLNSVKENEIKKTKNKISHQLLVDCGFITKE